MIAAGLKTTLTYAIEERLKFFLDHPREDVFEYLAKHFGTVSDEETVVDAGYKAFYNRSIKETIWAPQTTHRLLRELKSDYELYLVTAGSPPTQQKKVELLDFKKYFKKIYYPDYYTGEQKKIYFNKILRTLRSDPSRVLCVGNRLDVEIYESKSLGMTTCYVPNGEFRRMKPRRASEFPDYTIKKLFELRNVCKI